MDRCIGIDEAATRLGVRPSTLEKWARSGKIESVRLGRRRVFREGAVAQFIAAGIQPAKDSTVKGLDD